MSTLHYIFDPLCGWCYAAAPLVKAAREVPGLKIVFHGGGMLVGDHRRPITPDWREYVLPHDQRISAMTGQPFGSAYTDGLLRDESVVLDSAPPTTAILAAQAMAGRGLDMLARAQQAHYVEGRSMSDPRVLAGLAVDLGLHEQAFTAEFERLRGPATDAHIASSRRWLAQLGSQGFPTFSFERHNGMQSVQEPGRWLADPAGWQAHLVSLIEATRKDCGAA